MGFMTIIPLMFIPVAIYNVIAWSGETFASADWVRARLDTDFISVPMASGATWDITPGAALIALALLMLFFELLKSTGTGKAAVMNHAFSMVIFIVCLIEFLMFGAFASSIFFLITLMTLLDVMAGFMVTIAAARRDFGVGEGFGD
ncbi:hypothetical protein [Robiginitomaculum antarcticum]|uniref:hypothetical protein n=1 Tax=Robiginitomaculum antarcticum TaxID=437507 RepID=UPI00038214EF|nr:hypothetical protein [Robiginitomaculum antarcticum]